MSPAIVLIIFTHVYPWYELQRYIRQEKKRIANIKIDDCTIIDHRTGDKYGIAKHKYTNEYILIKRENGKWGY